MEWPKDMLEEIEDFRSERSIRCLKVWRHNSSVYIPDDGLCVAVERGDREAERRREVESFGQSSVSSRVSSLQLQDCWCHDVTLVR
jgi:hypothetical protein